MTTFKRSIQLCGLSQREASEFLGLSLQSVKDYSRGFSEPAKQQVWIDLSTLFKAISKGDVDDMPEGAKEAAEVLKFLKSVKPSS